MGSGSSKSAANPPAKSSKTAPPKPVANVNKSESKGNLTVSTGISSGVESNLHLSGPIAPIEINKRDSKITTREYENEKKSKNNKPVSNTKGSTHNPSALQFEDDSDVDDDIDAVLKIPMANEPSKRGKDKNNKKEKNSDKENIDNRQMNNDFYNNQNFGYPQKENDSLPETYAQRLQRQQYKLQQEMLIREKTSIKNLREWQYEDEDDDDHDDIMNDSPRRGFDASKFRAANKGGDVKSDFFSTVKDDLQTPRYLQSSGQELNDVDTYRRESDSPRARLPQYNQSELDLMRQLEEEIL